MSTRVRADSVDPVKETVLNAIQENSEIAVVTVKRMASTEWTNGNPPKGELDLNESLTANFLPRTIHAVWAAPPLMLCGVDPTHENEAIERRWEEEPFPGYKPGDKLIIVVAGPNDYRYKCSGRTKLEQQFFVLLTDRFSEESRLHFVSSIQSVRNEWKSLKASWDDADFEQLCNSSTDIVIGHQGPGVPFTCQEILVDERLKDSCRPEFRQLKRPLYVWCPYSDYPHGRSSYEAGFIAFLRASDATGNWEPSAGWPAQVNGSAYLIHIYNQLTFRYFPVRRGLWAIPLSKNRLDKVKQALQKLGPPQSMKQPKFNDIALQAVTLARNIHPPYVGDNLSKLEEDNKQLCKLYTKIVGSDSEYEIDPLTYLTQIYKKTNRTSEAKAVEEKIEQIRNARDTTMLRAHAASVADW